MLRALLFLLFLFLASPLYADIGGWAGQSIEQHNDVDQSTTPSDGQILKWNAITRLWEYAADSGGSSNHTIQNNSVTVSSYNTTNFIAGSGITLDIQNATNRTNITITSSAGGGNMSGAGTNEQISYFTGTNTITGNGNMTFNATTNLTSLYNLSLSVPLADASVANGITLDSLTQITTRSHTALSDIGTNSHATIDTFIASKAAASGLASLDGSSLVVQNPASATATPTASKIPVADGSAKLDGWMTLGAAVDISSETNLSGDTEVVLTGDALSLAAGVTRDTEWDTEAEVQTAWGGANIIIATEIDTSAEVAAILGDETGSGLAVFATSPTLTTPAIGAATATTPAADDNDTSVATTAYVQGEIATNYYWTLLPQGAVLDDNSPPAITILESTGAGTSRRYVADFDAATDEIIYWSFVLPADYSGGNITATVLWFANDTGANETCFWETQISATTEAAADSMIEDAGATVNTASEDVGTTEANRLISTAVTISNLDSAAAGDFVTLRFARDANNASDDLSSDSRLLAVRLTIPRS